MARSSSGRKPGVVYVSPSQVSVFQECQRKWGYRYIDKIRPPPKPEQEFGLLGHDRNEKWLEHGTPVGDDDVGKVCQQGIKKGFMPTPSPELLIEQELKIPIFGGKGMMLGYIDCVKPPEGDETPLVCDWKFTKDLRWAKKEDELDEDPQVAVYGKAALMVYGEHNEVTARWVYFCGRVNKNSEDGRPRTPRGVRKVERTYTREQIEAMWEDVIRVAGEIIKAKKTFKKAVELPANIYHCDAYGGCDHREYCPLPAQSSLSALGSAFAQYNKTHTSKNKPTPNNGEGTHGRRPFEHAYINGSWRWCRSSTRGRCRRSASRQAR
jgi:hypothetical protein